MPLQRPVGCQADLRKKGVCTTKLNLFGSQASGATHRWSNSDTCVLVPQAPLVDQLANAK